jgi:hypothetical protein
MRDARPDCMEFEHGLSTVATVKKLISPVEVDELESGQGNEGLIRILESHYVVVWDLATPLMRLQDQAFAIGLLGMIPVEELNLLRLIFGNHGEFVEFSEILHQLDVGRSFKAESVEKMKLSITFLISENLNDVLGDPSHQVC